MMSISRYNYIQDCKNWFNSLQKNHQVLITYLRKVNEPETVTELPVKVLTFNGDTVEGFLYAPSYKSPKLGVLVAIKDGTGAVQISWSMAHVKAEPFDRYIGLKNALTRATGATESVDKAHPPSLVLKAVADFKDKARRYFKTDNIQVIL